MLVFNEWKYLRDNPDVKVAVESGLFRSGEEHWKNYGRHEGRYADYGAQWIETPVYEPVTQGRMTFVIPCYNNCELTQRTVENIQSQNDVRFVFIDNGSTDGTPDFLHKVKNSVTITNSKNEFVVQAWNQGLRQVLLADDSDYVCICNNDILVGERWLEPIFTLFHHRRDELYIPVNNNKPDDAFSTEKQFQEYASKIHSHRLRLQFQETNFIGFCMFMRFEHLKLFYPIPESLKLYHGDDYLVDMLGHHGIKAAKVNRCAVYHLLGATRNIISISDQVIAEDHAAWEQIQKKEYNRRRIAPYGQTLPESLDPPMSTDRCLLL